MQNALIFAFLLYGDCMHFLVKLETNHKAVPTARQLKKVMEGFFESDSISWVGA